MAWNEPGGNSNNQDPWGNRKRVGQKQGPPDLDEALRKLQDNLKSLFGGGKKPGSTGSGGGFGFGIVAVVVAVLAAMWLYTAVYSLDEQEQAVILRLGKYHETVGPGLNIYFPPMDRKYEQNVTRERAYTRQGPR